MAKVVFIVFILSLWLVAAAPFSNAESRSPKSQLLAHAGESYTGFQDPAYLAYDTDLRTYMVEQIRKQFGIRLEPKTYSGLKLLEIEALFKCRKSNEPYERLLKIVK